MGPGTIFPGQVAIRPQPAFPGRVAIRPRSAFPGQFLIKPRWTYADMYKAIHYSPPSPVNYITRSTTYVYNIIQLSPLRLEFWKEQERASGGLEEQDIENTLTGGVKDWVSVQTSIHLISISLSSLPLSFLIHASICCWITITCYRSVTLWPQLFYQKLRYESKYSSLFFTVTNYCFS